MKDQLKTLRCSSTSSVVDNLFWSIYPGLNQIAYSNSTLLIAVLTCLISFSWFSPT